MDGSNERMTRKYEELVITSFKDSFDDWFVTPNKLYV
jgi:hypothetical protein